MYLTLPYESNKKINLMFRKGLTELWVRRRRRLVLCVIVSIAAHGR